MKNSKIYFGEYERYLFLKLVGETTMNNVFALKKGLSKMDMDDYHFIIIDFSQSDYLDSTSLGIVAALGMKLKKKHQRKKIAFVHFSEELKENFLTFGFDKIVDMDMNPPFSISNDSLVELKSGSREFEGKDLLKAHKELVRLNPNNEKVFKNVIDLMEKELKRKESSE